MVGNDVDDQREKEQHNADEEQHVIMGAAACHFTHFRGDGGGHGAGGFEQGDDAFEHGRRVAGHHHHGHCFPQSAADTQHDGGDHSAARGWQGHTPDGLPAGDAQRIRCFAVRLRHGVQRIFPDRYDGGDGNERQQQRAGEGGQTGGQVEPFTQGRGKENDADETQHHGRNARQQFDHGFQDLLHTPWSDLGDIDGRANAKGNGDQDGEKSYQQRAGKKRQDAEQVFDRVPACGKEVAERYFTQRWQPFTQQKEEDQQDNEDAGESGDLDDARDELVFHGCLTHLVCMG